MNTRLIRNDPITTKFSPSVATLKRMMKVVLEENAITRTELSLKANVHYTRLVRHLYWLQQKRYVVFEIGDDRKEEQKMVVKLTEKGREFGNALLSLCE